jgi:hypothetical protein
MAHGPAGELPPQAIDARVVKQKNAIRDAMLICRLSVEATVTLRALHLEAANYGGFAMFQLIYISREKQAFSPSALKKLLVGARIRNHEVNVTGILIYNVGMFLQALEGEEADVRKFFSRIEKDPRHGDISVLHSSASLGNRRMFGEWSMAFADAADAAKILRGFIDLKSGLSLATLDASRAMDILKACSQQSLPLSA